MAEFRIALGGVLDVATPSEVADATDQMAKHLQGHMDKKFAALTKGEPIRRTLIGSATVTLTTGQTSIIRMSPEMPASDRIWTITRFTVVGADDHTAVTNLVAALYVGDELNPTLAQCIIPGEAIPNFNTFNKDNVWALESDAVFVNLSATGAVTAQQVVVSMSVNEYVSAARMATWV